MKNIFIILVIIILPMAIFWGLEKKDSLKISQPANAQIQTEKKPSVLKFYSQMCLDCRLLTNEINKVDKQLKEKVSLKNIDVQDNNPETKKLIKKYNVEVVPTCIFLSKDEKVKLKKEGFIEKNKFENYLKELING